jgi:hypothetical protein
MDIPEVDVRLILPSGHNIQEIAHERTKKYRESILKRRFAEFINVKE